MKKMLSVALGTTAIVALGFCLSVLVLMYLDPAHDMKHSDTIMDQEDQVKMDHSQNTAQVVQVSVQDNVTHHVQALGVIAQGIGQLTAQTISNHPAFVGDLCFENKHGKRECTGYMSSHGVFVPGSLELKSDGTELFICKDKYAPNSSLHEVYDTDMGKAFAFADQQ